MVEQLTNAYSNTLKAITVSVPLGDILHYESCLFHLSHKL